MLILANVLALALIANGPATTAPAPDAVVCPPGYFYLGGQLIPLAGFEPDGPGPKGAAPTPADSPLPRISRPRSDPDQGPDEPRRMTLAEAIRIGLENSEVIRVLPRDSRPADGSEPAPPGVVAAGREANRADIAIAQTDADASIWKFQGAVMAHVRSIEQQYWSLSQQEVAVRAREAAVKLGGEILARETAELERSRGGDAGVAEAAQQLENSRLNLVTAISDLITTERQLRNILGLPTDVRHRIVAATEPIEAKVEPDWDSCLREMLASQPDIVQQRQLVRLTELQLLLARNQLLPPMDLNAVYRWKGLGDVLDQSGLVAPLQNLSALLGRAEARMHSAALDPVMPDCRDYTHQQTGLTASIGIAMGRAPLANTRQAHYQLIRQRASLDQVVHQATHSLARFFLEVDTNYKQFQTARRLRASAGQRLVAQRAFYEEGRISVDRLLDAVTQNANAIAQESQYQTSYNSSIAALEEAKGTLLAYDGITVVDRPIPREAPKPRDDRVAPASLQVAEPKVVEAVRPSPTSYKFRARLGGIQVLEVEVEVNGGASDKPGH